MRNKCNYAVYAILTGRWAGKWGGGGGRRTHNRQKGLGGFEMGAPTPPRTIYFPLIGFFFFYCIHLPLRARCTDKNCKWRTGCRRGGKNVSPLMDHYTARYKTAIRPPLPTSLYTANSQFQSNYQIHTVEFVGFKQVCHKAFNVQLSPLLTPNTPTPHPFTHKLD